MEPTHLAFWSISDSQNSCWPVYCTYESRQSLHCLNYFSILDAYIFIFLIVEECRIFLAYPSGDLAEVRRTNDEARLVPQPCSQCSTQIVPRMRVLTTALLVLRRVK